MLPIQTGTGTPSPSNIRPIYGHISAKATVTGKNMLRNSGALTSTTYGITFTKNSDGTVLATGKNNGNSTSLYRISINLPSGNYYFTPGPLDSALANSYVTMDGTTTRAKKWDGTTNSNISTGMLEEIKIEDGHVYWFYLRVRTNADTGDGVSFRPMVCSSLETNNVPAVYDATEYTTYFNQTVYGGTLDFITGALTKTWDYIASYSGETLPAEWISDRDEYSAGTTPAIGAEVAYKLATPQEVQLTPKQIMTRLGTNNIWVTTDTNEA